MAKTRNTGSGEKQAQIWIEGHKLDPKTKRMMLEIYRDGQFESWKSVRDLRKDQEGQRVFRSYFRKLRDARREYRAKSQNCVKNGRGIGGGYLPSVVCSCGANPAEWRIKKIHGITRVGSSTEILNTEWKHSWQRSLDFGLQNEKVLEFYNESVSSAQSVLDEDSTPSSSDVSTPASPIGTVRQPAPFPIVRLKRLSPNVWKPVIAKKVENPTCTIQLDSPGRDPSEQNEKLCPNQVLGNEIPPQQPDEGTQLSKPVDSGEESLFPTTQPDPIPATLPVLDGDLQVMGMDNNNLFGNPIQTVQSPNWAVPTMGLSPFAFNSPLANPFGDSPQPGPSTNWQPPISATNNLFALSPNSGATVNLAYYEMQWDSSSISVLTMNCPKDMDCPKCVHLEEDCTFFEAAEKHFCLPSGSFPPGDYDSQVPHGGVCPHDPPPPPPTPSLENSNVWFFLFLAAILGFALILLYAIIRRKCRQLRWTPMGNGNQYGSNGYSERHSNITMTNPVYGEESL